MINVFEHPWLGGLFGDPEAAAIWSAERQMTHMLAFEAAFTRALGDVGQVPQATAERVAKEIETFRPDLSDLRAGTAQDGLVIPSLVGQLRAAVGAEAKAVHTGTTSQDVIDTALSLTVKEFNTLLGARLDTIATAIDHLIAQFGEGKLTGRTRMQAALPIQVADRLVTWRDPLRHHHARLQDIRPQVERLQLGGAVGDRAALSPHGDAIAATMARALGLENPPRAWHATRDAITEYAGLLSLISGTLGKMGQDICLMAQQGIDEIAMDGGGTSSAMPHKQNPILAELLVTLARFNATQVSAMHQALIHEQERSGTAWALEWMILPQMAQVTARSLSTATEICHKITRIGSAG